MNNIVSTRVLRVVFAVALLLGVFTYIFGPMETLVSHHILRSDYHKFRLQNTTNLAKSNIVCNASSNLGPIKVNKTKVELSELNINPIFKNVSLGGYYKPPCSSDKVAIIVPYRDRENNLSIFLNNIHQFLMVQQQIEYGIFIVEQYGKSSFNRGKLMNVGFVESQNLKEGGWDCFIFHDVDLLPTDTSNIYACPNMPRHMSAAIDVFKYKLPYNNIFGGVSAMTKEQFTKVNGFSNDYWGWGGEDDDLYSRIKAVNLSIERYNMKIARYTMLSHAKAVPNPIRKSLLLQTKYKFKKDGLSSLQYFVINMNRYHLFTHIVVNIG